MQKVVQGFDAVCAVLVQGVDSALELKGQSGLNAGMADAVFGVPLDGIHPRFFPQQFAPFGCRRRDGWARKVPRQIRRSIVGNLAVVGSDGFLKQVPSGSGSEHGMDYWALKAATPASNQSMNFWTSGS